MDTKVELEKQERDIKKALLKVFIPIVIVLVPIIYYQEKKKVEQVRYITYLNVCRQKNMLVFV